MTGLGLIALAGVLIYRRRRSSPRVVNASAPTRAKKGKKAGAKAAAKAGPKAAAGKAKAKKPPKAKKKGGAEYVGVASGDYEGFVGTV